MSESESEGNFSNQYGHHFDDAKEIGITYKIEGRH